MINYIIGNVYIGDWQDAKYNNKKFNDIFTVAKDCPFIGNHFYPMVDGTYEKNYELMVIAINDLLKTSLDKEKNILVHCVSGFSRSTTVVIGYMINKYDINNRPITVGESLSYIKEIRPLANPSQELLKLLKIHEKEI